MFKVIKSLLLLTFLVNLVIYPDYTVQANNNESVIQTSLKPTDELFQKIIERDDYKKATENYNVYINWSMKYSYSFNNDESVLIPISSKKIKQNRDVLEHYLVYNLKNGEISKSLVLAIEQDSEDTDKGYVSISDINSNTVYTGTFEGGSYIGMTIESTETFSTGALMVQSESLVECLDRLFADLPLWAQTACWGACGAFWTPLGATICAGCLVGLGFNC